MSGLFGAKGPSPLSMLRGELRDKRKYDEMPGFSGTKFQDKSGRWRKARGPSSSKLLRRGFRAFHSVKSPVGREMTKVKALGG